jgi:tetratricopeptide (TPR) repeat protein
MAQPRRRWLWVVAAAVVLAVVGIVMWQQLRLPRTVTEEAEPLQEPAPFPFIEEWVVVVEPFENRTGDPSLDLAGPRLVDRLVDGLARITQGLQSLPSVNVLMAEGEAGELTDAGVAALDHQGRILVTGSYAARDSELEVVAQVRDLDSRRVLYTTEPIEVPRQPRGDQLQPFLQRVMGAVGIHMHMGLDNSSHVPDYDVFREYLAGWEESWSGVGSGIGRIEGGLRADPEFLRAASFLAERALFRISRIPEAPPYLDHIRQRSHRLTEFESLELELYEGWMNGSPGQALRAARRLQELAPTDVLIRYYRARFAGDLNRAGEVVEALASTMDHIPRSFVRLRQRAHRDLRRAYDRLGQYEQLLELAGQMRREAPGETDPFSAEAVALVGLDRLDELDALVEECRSLPGGECDVASVMVTASWYLAARGHREESLDYGNRAAGHLEALPQEEFQRRQALYLNALRGAVRWDDYAAVAQRRTESFEKTSDLYAYYRSCIGMAAARSGDRETAEAVIAELEAREDLCYAAHVAGYLGDLDRAVEYLRRSIEVEPSITYSQLMRWDLDLEPLWGYEPFEELLVPKG